MKNRLVDAGFQEGRIEVIPNMVSLPGAGVTPTDGKYIAFAGRLSPEKGIETLITASRLTALPVKIAGDHASMPEAVEAAPPNMQFMGQLRKDQLGGFYRGARFSVVPSIWHEPFGLVLVEAMSHGLPVIASRIGGMQEIVEDGINGFLFDPGDTEDLADKMKILWDNPELCRKMGRAGREKAAREYSEEAYKRRLMAAYDRALGVLQGPAGQK